MRVKYKDEMRFALGVALTQKEKDGPVEGKRCAMVDYTGKVIIPEKEENRRIKEEIKRVKSLTSRREP